MPSLGEKEKPFALRPRAVLPQTLVFYWQRASDTSFPPLAVTGLTPLLAWSPNLISFIPFYVSYYHSPKWQFMSHTWILTEFWMFLNLFSPFHHQQNFSYFFFSLNTSSTSYCSEDTVILVCIGYNIFHFIFICYHQGSVVSFMYWDLRLHFPWWPLPLTRRQKGNLVYIVQKPLGLLAFLAFRANHLFLTLAHSILSFLLITLSV